MQNTEAHAQSPFAARIVIALTPELGPHTASQVLRLVCERAGKTAVTLEAGDLSAAQEVVGRMLRTLLGPLQGDQVLNWIAVDDSVDPKNR